MSLSDHSAERLRSLQARMKEAGVDLVAIAPTPNMRYLLGFAPLPDERPCALLVGTEAYRLVVPGLNADQVEAHTGASAIRWSDETGPLEAMQAAMDGLAARGASLLAVDDTMRADHLRFLLEVINPERWVAAGELMSELRIRKSELEIEILARAASIADDALLAGVEACQPGATEREVASVVERYFRQQGAERVDFVTIASGPNSAFPHHETGDRALRAGDTILIDVGATFEGYKSDITRMAHLGEPPPEVLAVVDAVREANRRGREAAVAGTLAREVDQAARGSLEEAGYGPHFLHRTGHGLGMEIHEPPWISANSDTKLEPGMVFSVEPGVYLPSDFGVRIEDIVVVTEGASRCLSQLGRDLIVRPG